MGERIDFGGMVILVEKEHDEWTASLQGTLLFGKGRTMQEALGALMKIGLMVKQIENPLLTALGLDLNAQTELARRVRAGETDIELCTLLNPE